MPRRPISLQNRLIWAASLALFAFLGLTGFALDRAFYDSSRQALRDRLQSYVWAYLSGSDVSVAGKLILPEFPPDPRFERPQSGLYAGVVGEGIKWSSLSALGRKLPFDVRLAPNEQSFIGPVETGVGGIYVFSLGVDYAYGDQTRRMPLTFHVAEHESALARQMRVFRRTLWTWLAGLGVALLIVEVLLLRWSLRPLRQVAVDLARVERGEDTGLQGGYPRELEGLTHSLNEFIESEREQRSRHRNTLSNLAHSLKTPLAVVRSELETESDDATLRDVIGEQVRRMDEIVQYQLSRGATAGHKTFVAPIALDEPAEEIVRSLEKVYAESMVLCEFDIEPQACFYGERGDLTEMLGNLLENAFKWAKHRVLLTARRTGPIGARRPGLEVVVEDDGPGIPEEKVAQYLQRGVRGDEHVQGHGIGLAIVQDILKAYRGELVVSRSEALGGAAFTLRFAAVP